MLKLLCNVSKISGGQMPQMPSLVACLYICLDVAYEFSLYFQCEKGFALSISSHKYILHWLMSVYDRVRLQLNNPRDIAFL